MTNKTLSSQSCLKEYYEHPSNVHKEWDPIDRVRIPAIMECLPSNIHEQSLEIGVAAGKLFKELQKHLPAVVGVDLSLHALRTIGQGQRVVANAKDLPFSGTYFQLCVAADVLEHLTEDEFMKAVHEIGRVTEKFILVNVPYREHIGGPVAKCMRCNKEFNVYGHLRSFNKRNLLRLFKGIGFKQVRSVTIGPYREQRSNFLFRLGRRWGKAYSSDFTVCPSCGACDINPKRSFVNRCIGKTIYLIQVFIDKLTPRLLKARSEIIILFERAG